MEVLFPKLHVRLLARVIEEKAHNPNAHVSCAQFPEHIAAMETGIRSTNAVFCVPNLQPDFSLGSYLCHPYYQKCLLGRSLRSLR